MDLALIISLSISSESPVLSSKAALYSLHHLLIHLIHSRVSRTQARPTLAHFANPPHPKSLRWPRFFLIKTCLQLMKPTPRALARSSVAAKFSFTHSRSQLTLTSHSSEHDLHSLTEARGIVSEPSVGRVVAEPVQPYNCFNYFASPCPSARLPLRNLETLDYIW